MNTIEYTYDDIDCPIDNRSDVKKFLMDNPIFTTIATPLLSMFGFFWLLGGFYGWTIFISLFITLIVCAWADKPSFDRDMMERQYAIDALINRCAYCGAPLTDRCTEDDILFYCSLECLENASK